MSDAASVILIAGPTASGKSAHALQLAKRHRGVIVNADSLQVYDGLRILTARPSAEDEAAAPHRLYGHVPPSVAYSVARWLEDVVLVLSEARREGWRPIIVGGTGLYFKALLEGLSPIPPIPDAIRASWRDAAGDTSAPDLHAELQRRDPVMAARLHPSDTQRIVRALEVIEATGRSLAEWQEIKGTPLLDIATTQRLVLRPPRDVLQARADARFDAMMAQGALEEVAAVVALDLDPRLPALQALGYRPLAAHLAGRMDLAEAVEAGKRETRQYIKRQETWLQRNMASWNKVQ